MDVAVAAAGLVVERLRGTGRLQQREMGVGLVAPGEDGRGGKDAKRGRHQGVCGGSIESR